MMSGPGTDRRRATLRAEICSTTCRCRKRARKMAAGHRGRCARARARSTRKSYRVACAQARQHPRSPQSHCGRGRPGTFASQTIALQDIGPASLPCHADSAQHRTQRITYGLVIPAILSAVTNVLKRRTPRAQFEPTAIPKHADGIGLKRRCMQHTASVK